MRAQPANVTAHFVGDKGKRTVFIVKFEKSVLAREEQVP
jgi:hypothetical protein